MLTRWTDFKNRLGFRWRNRLGTFRPRRLKKGHPVSLTDERLQREIAEFLGALDWAKYFPGSESLVAADIGARNFALAPVLHRLLAAHTKHVELHGIEIDAHRRLADLRTRADYGHYFAAQVPDTHFHAMDFLEWQKPLDVAFLLNPFVTPGPLLAWGLPLKLLKPDAIFSHARRLLEARAGILVTSSPSDEELALARQLLAESGFEIIDSHDWLPSESAVQKLPRHGLVARPIKR